MQNQSPQDDVLVVRNVGEKRTAGQWALLIGIPGVLVIAGVLVVLLLTQSKPSMNMAQRVPQADPATTAPAATPGTDTGAPLPVPGAPATTPAPEAAPGSTVVADNPGATAPPPMAPAAGAAPPVAAGSGTAVWGAFRGADRMNISNESLARSFPAGGPRILWRMNLGEGHAGAAVFKGRAFILDYDTAGRRDVLRCLDLNSGKQIWTQGYAVDIKSNHGMSRTVPATDGKYVVTLGPMGQVMCCEAATGKKLWSKNLVTEYGTKIPEWYAAQCPLIEGSNVILAPGGKALMMSVSLATGKPVWTTPNPRGWQMTHCSIMPVDFAGKRMYVYPYTGGVAGVDAANGKLLWSTPDWTVNTANVPTPVPLGNGRLFVCGGYNSGAAFLQIGPGGTSVSITKRLGPNVFQSHQQTPILWQGYLYGVRAPRGDLVCMDLNGRVVWASPNTAKFALGPYIISGGLLYVLSDTGTLTIVEPNASGYKELAKAHLLSGGSAWAPIAVADGKMILRDKTTMLCLDMRP